MQGKIKSHLSDDAGIIELHLSSIKQLFNSFDPSPFHEKELDAEAERYLIGRALEHRRDVRLRLVVTVSRPLRNDVRNQHIPEAIHGHFNYRAYQSSQQLIELMRTGWISLAIGLLVLAICLLVIQYVGLTTSLNPLARLGEQSLLIFGWVANWRPIEIFLYDWWPIWRRQVLLRRLSKMSVEIKTVTVLNPSH